MKIIATGNQPSDALECDLPLFFKNCLIQCNDESSDGDLWCPVTF